MNARTLAAALLAIALLTLVLPPLAARGEHERRIARAQHDVRQLADGLLGERSAELGAALPASARSLSALTGTGAVPKLSPGLAWPEGRTFPATALFGGLADPWGNHYFVLVTEAPRRLVVLSAGPNGTVEAPFMSAAQPVGDDIVMVR